MAPIPFSTSAMTGAMAAVSVDVEELAEGEARFQRFELGAIGFLAQRPDNLVAVGKGGLGKRSAESGGNAGDEESLGIGFCIGHNDVSLVE